jgi:hypothetical protein
MTPHEQIMAAIANYREGNFDLSSLLERLQEIQPRMTVHVLACYLDQYFEEGGE